MIFWKKKKAETLEEKFARLLDFNERLIESTRLSIDNIKISGDIRLALSNYSHLIHDHCDTALMLWRSGKDPRQIIADAHDVYNEMVSYRNQFDPDAIFTMAQIQGTADWDLLYSLFWLIGKHEPFDFYFADYQTGRYFIYSRYILCKTTNTKIPDDIEFLTMEAQKNNNDFVDKNFRDLLMLFDDRLGESETQIIVERITSNWYKRRNLDFYYSDAADCAGHDVSNDLSIDYQLACILKRNRWVFPENPHFWRWD
jgi:hypothetical protein